MENESGHQRRGRSGSRASSTSSSLEVRCACQYFRSDSLLPERSALAAASRPAAKHTAQRMVQTPPAGRRPPVRCGDHDYEPIGEPIMRLAVSQHSVVVRSIAPVVKITDTDVVPVADSDDSIDDRYRFQHGALILDGDVILPLDGRIEDDAMDGRNLGDQTTVDTSGDELESPQQMQDRIEERFFNVTEERNGLDVVIPSPQQVEIVGADEQEVRPGLQERLKSQAGKIRSRFKSIQKPNFKIAKGRAKAGEKRPSSPPSPAKAPASPRGSQKASRMERFRMALPERPRFSLPDKSKFHLPERPKFNLPDRSKFHIKKPNIQLPKSLGRPRRSPSQRAATQPPTREPSVQEPSAESKSSGGGSRRNIFDFSTLPRPKKLFERRAKPAKTEPAVETTTTTTTTIEYVTSSPKESRAQSSESSTFPRAKKPGLSLSARWAQRFGETVRGFHDDSAPESKESAVDRSKPWRHPSLEEPRLSLKPQTSEDEEDELEEKLPWENAERRTFEEPAAPPPDEQEEIVYADREDVKESTSKKAEEVIKDPRLDDERLMSRLEPEEPKKKVRLVEEDDDDDVSTIDPEAEDEEQTYHPKALYDGSFPPVDPPEFRDERGHSVELSEDEEGSSMRSDREIQQSSGSSCERRRRGVIEEIDSDEFFLREKGISEENVRFHLISEIRDALRPRAAPEDEAPPERPKRTRSARKRMDASSESFEAGTSAAHSAAHSAAQSAQQSFERAGSLSSRHRIVYHTESSSRERDELAGGPPDDGPRAARRRSKGSLGSRGRLALDEQNIVLAPIRPDAPPVPPSRRKRLRREQSSSLSLGTVDSAAALMYNGFAHSNEGLPATPPPSPPAYSYRRREDEELEYVEPAAPERPPPVPPKRTRSRTASLAPEDDRTSHGADSLPGDFGFADEELAPAGPGDSSSREPSLPGYAVIDRRERPPRPPPPRRRRQEKFATAPRPAKTGPQRPLRNYSTLRPAKSDTIRSSDSVPFLDADFALEPDAAEDFHRELQSGEMLSKIQGRPLPAPPRPPRHRRGTPTIRQRSLPRDITPDFSETVASTQTDPLPDDLVIEEEVTTAKLVVSPSRSGSSQVLISAERQSSPASGSYRSAATPPIPPLPAGGAQSRDTDDAKAADRESERKVPPSDEPRRFDPSQLEILRSALFSTDEPIRIPSLEVGDLRVERLTVSQLEAYKVAASEIDAIVVSASEMSRKGDTDAGIHPSLLQELIAIRNQLEAVTAAQSLSRPQSAMEDAYTATSNERVDIPIEEQRKPADRKAFARESSPLLIVQQAASEAGATVEMGRTVFPLTSSAANLSMTAESTTVSDTTTVVTTEVIESVITISERPGEQPTTKSEEPTTATTTTTTTSSPATAAISTSAAESKSASKAPRSRSSSPSRSRPGVVRQTASPVKSLPPVISVTPDSITTPGTQDNMPLRHTTSSGVQPQRAVISYRSEDTATAGSLPASRETSQSPPPPAPPAPPSSPPAREASRSPPPPPPAVHAQYIAFPTSHIPPEFFALANPPLTTTDHQRHPPHHQQRPLGDAEPEPSVADTAGELLRALHHAGNRSFRHFVDSVVSRFAGGSDDGAVEPEQKVRRVELALCALLVLVACLIVVCICTPRTITHHHHWDYFNPPQ